MPHPRPSRSPVARFILGHDSCGGSGSDGLEFADCFGDGQSGSDVDGDRGDECAGSVLTPDVWLRALRRAQASREERKRRGNFARHRGKVDVPFGYRSARGKDDDEDDTRIGVIRPHAALAAKSAAALLKKRAQALKDRRNPRSNGTLGIPAEREPAVLATLPAPVGPEGKEIDNWYVSKYVEPLNRKAKGSHHRDAAFFLAAAPPTADDFDDREDGTDSSDDGGGGGSDVDEEMLSLFGTRPDEIDTPIEARRRRKSARESRAPVRMPRLRMTLSAVGDPDAIDDRMFVPNEPPHPPTDARRNGLTAEEAGADMHRRTREMWRYAVRQVIASARNRTRKRSIKWRLRNERLAGNGASSTSASTTRTLSPTLPRQQRREGSSPVGPAGAAGTYGAPLPVRAVSSGGFITGAGTISAMFRGSSRAIDSPLLRVSDDAVPENTGANAAHRRASPELPRAPDFDPPNHQTRRREGRRQALAPFGLGPGDMPSLPTPSMVRKALSLPGLHASSSSAKVTHTTIPTSALPIYTDRDDEEEQDNDDGEEEASDDHQSYRGHIMRASLDQVSDDNAAPPTQPVWTSKPDLPVRLNIATHLRAMASTDDLSNPPESPGRTPEPPVRFMRPDDLFEPRATSTREILHSSLEESSLAMLLASPEPKGARERSRRKLLPPVVQATGLHSKRYQAMSVVDPDRFALGNGGDGEEEDE